jgi:predicted metal-dependent hydrolase
VIEPRSGSKRSHGQSPRDLAAASTSRRLEAGIELIRRGEYFAAHEELELAWRAAPQDERDFFQGLVHVAVAWYQAGRGRQIGTERQLAKAIRRLTPYAPAHRGLDLDALLVQLRSALEVAQADRLEHAVRIDLDAVELVEEQQ